MEQTTKRDDKLLKGRQNTEKEKMKNLKKGTNFKKLDK